ncbi:MAG: hypothetical protein KDK30_13750, partial [Leptospiraceae bacterium]|nr:hypothetical protein [Leptospiraceae bacterium]
VLLCSGKIYYDLLQMKVEQQLNHLAIVRIEQLYPYPVNSIASILQKYSNADEICWVQEEPRNQGAWLYMEDRLFAQIDDHQDLLYIGRLPSPSPATGYFKVHQREQSEILERAVRLRSDSGIRLIRSGQSS